MPIAHQSQYYFISEDPMLTLNFAYREVYVTLKSMKPPNSHVRCIRLEERRNIFEQHHLHEFRLSWI